MEQRFSRYFIIVASAHLLVIAILLLIGGCRNLFKPKPVVMMPVEVMVAAPTQTAPPKVREIPPPKPEPKPALQPNPKPVSKPKPKPKPHKVKVSHKRVVRGTKTTSHKDINEQEIKKILSKNLQTGKTAYNPNLASIDLARIKQALYDAWEQPSREEAGGITVKAEITLAIDGRITGRRLIKASGNIVLDQSVMKALNAVQKIYGLSPGFARSHKRVIIEFMVD